MCVDNEKSAKKKSGKMGTTELLSATAKEVREALAMSGKPYCVKKLLHLTVTL